jgi:hypothetical protein
MVSTDAVSQQISEHVAAIDSDTAGIGYENSPELVELGGMSEQDFDKLKKEVKGRVDKLFSEKDVDNFLAGWDELLEDVEKKTAFWLGNSVPIPVLVKIAASSEEAKRVLGPVLVAAKKKKDKGKGKKKDKAEGKAEGGPPFGKGGGRKGDGKKPDGKGPHGEGPKTGLGKGPCKKRKAVEIVEADLDW